MMLNKYPTERKEKKKVTVTPQAGSANWWLRPRAFESWPSHALPVWIQQLRLHFLIYKKKS